MTKFEQLVEYVINDDEAKAKALFHDIVVEKSREIYEDLMQDEEGVEEGMEPDADAADALIKGVEMDETGMMEADDEMADDEADDEMDADDEMADMDAMDDMAGEEGGAEPATKDDVLNLEDKLDQLMAEFEQLLDTENNDMGDDMDADMGDEELAPGAGGDAYAMDDTAEFGSDELAEAVNLKAAPKPVTSEEGNTYKKSPVAANAGAKNALAKPVSSGANEGGRHDSSAYSNSSKELIGKVGNSPAGATQNLKPATKPHLAQATGVNTKSPVKS